MSLWGINLISTSQPRTTTSSGEKYFVVRHR
jgi:hypothetical protein